MMSRFRHGIAGMIMLAIDVLIFNGSTVMAFILTYYINEGRMVHYVDLIPYRDMTTFTVGVPMLVYVISGLYRTEWARAKIEDYSLIIRSQALATVGMLSAGWVFRYEEQISNWPTSTFIYTFLIASVAMVYLKMSIRFLQDTAWFEGIKAVRVLMVELKDMDRDSFDRILKNDNPRYELIGYVGEKTKDPPGELPWLGSLDQCKDAIDKAMLDEIFVMSSNLTHEELFKIVRLCEARRVPYEIIPSPHDLLSAKARIDLVNYVPMISYASPGIAGWNAFFKTFFDFTFSLFVLFGFLPLWLLIWILIKCDSKGPALYSQTRIGLKGKPFKIYKFRTMRVGADQEQHLTTDNDQRITRVGRWLRRTSLDEIPQLINVLRFEMSWVGPRAVIPEVVADFADWEKLSLNILPGITGLAQVSGRNILSFNDKSYLNVYYIRNYSLMLDIKILLRTTLTVVAGSGTGGTKTRPVTEGENH